MATRLEIDFNSGSELMARDDIWGKLPNIKLMSIWTKPEEGLVPELKDLFRVERSGDQRTREYCPTRTIPQIMNSMNRGMFICPTSNVTAAWNIKLYPPKDLKEAEQLQSFLNVTRDVRSIETTTQYLGPRFTHREFSGILNQLHAAGSTRNVKSLSFGFDFETDPTARYTDIVTNLGGSFTFGTDDVENLAIRGYRAYSPAEDRLCPTLEACFGTPDLAQAFEGLISATIDVSGGNIPAKLYIPKSVREFTLRYRVPDLLDDSAVEEMASRLGEMDVEGSLIIKIESDFKFEVQGYELATMASNVLEEARLKRKAQHESQPREPDE